MAIAKNWKPIVCKDSKCILKFWLAFYEKVPTKFFICSLCFKVARTINTFLLTIHIDKELFILCDEEGGSGSGFGPSETLHY